MVIAWRKSGSRGAGLEGLEAAETGWTDAILAATRAISMVMAGLVRMIVICGDPRGLIGQRQEGIALGAGMTSALLLGEQHDKDAGQEQAEEYGYR